MNMFNLSSSELMSLAKQKRPEDINADPFPHICIDNLFNSQYLELILSEFQDLEPNQGIHFNNPNENKHASSGECQLSPSSTSLIHKLNSQPFLEFLQTLTNIKETLIPDPYLEGGGMHQIKSKGYLKIHVDFHQHKLMKLDRRVNVLVYLNKDWKEEYGGHFELWRKDMGKCAKKIAPTFNRLVVFSTTDDSWHGHPNPLNCPSNLSRKSLALYYYTNGRPSDDVNVDRVNRITTTFAARKGQDSSTMKLYNNLVNAANDILPPIVVRLLKKSRRT